jgi:antitoxin CptB
LPDTDGDSALLPLPALRWRCRRGMRELDVMLGQWLEQVWPEASPENRSNFQRLLDQEDDAIWDWMMGRVEPPEDLSLIVNDIRAQSISR